MKRQSLHCVHCISNFFSGYGTIVINYSFQSGIQGREHPNPGQSYGGTFREAYLPNTPEGCEVLQLLRRAFNFRLVFTVGTSATTGLHNQITWNDIHHKTTTHGGPYGYGILRLVNYYCQARCSVVRRLTNPAYPPLPAVNPLGIVSL